MYNYNKPNFMTNTSNAVFGASTSTFGQPGGAPNMPMFSSSSGMQPTNIFQTPSTSSFNTGATPNQPSFVENMNVDNVTLSEDAAKLSTTTLPTPAYPSPIPSLPVPNNSPVKFSPCVPLPLNDFSTISFTPSIPPITSTNCTSSSGNFKSVSSKFAYTKNPPKKKGPSGSSRNHFDDGPVPVVDGPPLVKVIADSRQPVKPQLAKTSPSIIENPVTPHYIMSSPPQKLTPLVIPESSKNAPPIITNPVTTQSLISSSPQKPNQFVVPDSSKSAPPIANLVTLKSLIRPPPPKPKPFVIPECLKNPPPIPMNPQTKKNSSPVIANPITPQSLISSPPQKPKAFVIPDSLKIPPPVTRQQSVISSSPQKPVVTLSVNEPPPRFPTLTIGTPRPFSLPSVNANFSIPLPVPKKFEEKPSHNSRLSQHVSSSNNNSPNRQRAGTPIPNFSRNVTDTRIPRPIFTSTPITRRPGPGPNIFHSESMLNLCDFNNNAPGCSHSKSPPLPIIPPLSLNTNNGSRNPSVQNTPRSQSLSPSSPIIEVPSPNAEPVLAAPTTQRPSRAIAVPVRRRSHAPIRERSHQVESTGGDGPGLHRGDLEQEALAGLAQFAPSSYFAEKSLIPQVFQNVWQPRSNHNNDSPLLRYSCTTPPPVMSPVFAPANNMYYAAEPFQNYYNQPFGSQLFGQQQQQQQQQASTSGLFGNSNTFGQNKSTFGFGSTQNSTGLFGQPQQQQQQPGSSLFQPNSQPLFGSGSGNTFGNIPNCHVGTVIKFSPVTGSDTMQKNGVAQSISTKHHCITCMKEYETKSLEELRFEDYSCNRKGPQQQNSFGATPPFGAATATPQNTGSLFGQTDNKTGFGQTTNTFGQASTFGQNNTFGVSSQSSGTGSLFGKSTFGAPTANTNTFGYQVPPTSNPFNANQPAKPFGSQPLFGTNTSQSQPTFGAGVFGQTNTQNAGSLFQKPAAQPNTGFNTGQSTFPFNQTQTAQAPNMFQVSKPNTGFGVFSQTNTGTATFGATGQPPQFGSTFGKTTPTIFAQPTQPTFGSSLGQGIGQQPSLFGNQAAKPPTLFGNTNTGGSSLFSNNVFQQPPAANNFSLGMAPSQPANFPPEPSHDMKNISLLASDSFPDGPQFFGLEPVLGEIGNNSATNPKDLKAVLDYSKKREALLSEENKIKVTTPKTKRGNHYNREFFETSQVLKTSHKCLVIRKFSNDTQTIYNKYKNELFDEVAQVLNAEDEENTNKPSVNGNTPLTNEKFDDLVEKVSNKTKKPPLKLQLESISLPGIDITPTRNEEKKGNNFKDSPSHINRNINLVGLSEDKVPENDNNIEAVNNDVTTPSEGTNDPSENPAGVILIRPEYYIYPSLSELGNFINENGECIVKGLTIGRKGYGNVYFSEPINITNMNLDEIVFFRYREIILYPEEDTKPPVGQGLNRSAQVTLDRIYPREKGTHHYLTDVDEIMRTNFVENLMQVTQKHNCKFVDYRPSTGSWVFKVKHFSKYSFTDSDEEECEVRACKQVLGGKPIGGLLRKPLERSTLTKINEHEDFSKMGLGGSTLFLKDKHQSQILAEPFSDDESMEINNIEDQEMSDVLDYFRPSTSTIQNIKSSLFTNLDQVNIQCDPSFRLIPASLVNVPTKIDIPKEVVTTPRVFSLARLYDVDQINTPQRCYTEMSLFQNNLFRVGFGRGYRFYNVVPLHSNEIAYHLNTCKINLGENTSLYNQMMPELNYIFNIVLNQSVVEFENNIPTFQVKNGTLFLKQQTELFTEHARRRGLTGKAKYLCSIWNLCTVLWSNESLSPCARRQELSNWLKTFTSELCEDARFSRHHHQTIFEKIFQLLTFFQVNEAAQFASDHQLNQLSLLISQMDCCNERIKSWISKNIGCFAWKENKVPIDFKKLYLLFAGIPEDEDINICAGLDWLRSFGLHLWYISPTASPIHVAFDMYKTAFEEHEYAVSPHAPYYSYSGKNQNYDLLYHILGLYVQNTYQLCEVLHPETHTDNLMDYRISWFLLQLFSSLKIGLLRDSEEEHLHTTFSNQLEQLGYWKWAIYVLLFLKNNVLKKNLVMRILDKNLRTSNLTLLAERELVQTFKLPPQWIHEVKAVKAKVAGKTYHYYQHLYHMKDYQAANAALIDLILPDLFINEQFDLVKYFINTLKPFSRKLKNWNTECGLIDSFIALQETLYNNDSEQSAYAIMDKLVSLSKRTTLFTPRNVKQKLCIVELLRKNVLLFAVIKKRFNLVYDEQILGDTQSSMLIPPDYRMYEVFRLIRNI